MKKTITTGKTKKTTAREKSTSSNYLPSEDEVRQKANEIYMQRIEREEDGSAENDWSEAEKILRESN